MSGKEILCSKSVVMEKKCSCGSSKLIKHGFTKSKSQRLKCLTCNKTRVGKYSNKACHPDINQHIVVLTKEGLGIRSTARVLTISPTTLLKRLLSIARNVVRPAISKGKTYEVDELCTFIGNKKRVVWIAYALERESRKVVSYSVGSRTNKTLQVVLNSLHLSEAKSIYTDGLQNYRYLISKDIHKITRFGTNHIERNNLTLRTRLKRLSRRTICYSKSLGIITAVLSIYFWA